MELKLVEVCEKVKIMSRHKSSMPSKTDVFLLKIKLRLWSKRRLLNYLRKTKENVASLFHIWRKVEIMLVMSMMKVRCLVHNVLEVGDIEIVSAVRIIDIQLTVQRQTSIKLIVQFGSLNPKYELLRLVRKLWKSEGYRNVFIHPDQTKHKRLKQFHL